MNRAQITYSSKDYESLRRDLISRIPQMTDRWTDHNPSDLGIVLLELFCGIGDMLAYYMDTQAAEAYLPTVRQRQNLIELCKLVSYRLDTPVAATTTLEFSLPVFLNEDLVIPKHSVCLAMIEGEAVQFETVKEAMIPYGQASVCVDARQGIRKKEAFTSSGARHQKYKLSETHIAKGTITVIIQDQEWGDVHHFQESDATSLHFLTDIDGLDVTHVCFGDGVNGSAPPAGAIIEVEYLKTRGASGNLGKNLINQVMTPIYLNGSMVKISVTNPVPATGGCDRESMEHARKQAPAEVRSLWKAVTREDYKALAEGFPGIAKAKILDTNDCWNIHYYQVNLVVAPDGGGQPTSLLKSELAEYLEARKTITTEINIYDPFYRPVPIDADVFIFAREDAGLVRSRIESALKDHFDFDRVGFGQIFHASNLVSLISQTKGVSHVKLYTPSDDIALKSTEIPVLGDVNLTIKGAK